jgi:membrane protein
LRRIADRRQWGRTIPGRCIQGFLELQGIDRAMAIAAQAFTALIPLLIVASAWTSESGGNAVADAMIRRFRLTGESADTVRQLFAGSGPAVTSALGVVVLVFSGVSLTRRLQRMYLQAWRMAPTSGVRAQLSAAFGLGVLVLEISLLYFLRTLFGYLPLGAGLGWPLTVLAGVVLWTTVPWLLLDRRIAWRRLLPAGALAAGFVAIYTVATTIYMPDLLDQYRASYGLFGITLALVGWLLCVSIIVVATTVVAAELDRTQKDRARRRAGVEVARVG